MLVWMQCSHESPLLISRFLMVTDLHDRLWRRRGGGIGSIPTTTKQGDARTPILVYRGGAGSSPASACDRCGEQPLSKEIDLYFATGLCSGCSQLPRGTIKRLKLPSSGSSRSAPSAPPRRDRQWWG